MRIINSISNKKQNFEGLGTINYLANSFYDTNATLPTLLIESGVTLGRSYEANKRGGKKEAIERLVEQGLSALVWIYGVSILRNIGNFIGTKALKIKDTAFDVGSDFLRNPMKNNKISSKDKAFKVANTILSTAIATGFIGFVLPKINHKISSKFSSKEEDNKNKSLLKKIDFDDFKNKTNKNNLTFTSLLEKGTNFANLLENNSTARLLITDTGVISGRYVNGRDKYEKIEGLFRDISSIFFYLASTPILVKFLNKLAKNTNINPKAQESLVNMLKYKIESSIEINKDDFKETVSGSLDSEQIKSLDELFKDKKVISANAFIEKFPKYATKAKDMSKLQPIFDSNNVLTLTQAKDVLKDGWINEPEFLNSVYKKVTNGASVNPKKFVSNKYLEKVRTSLDDFVNQICNSLKEEDFSDKKVLIEKIELIAKKNKTKNFVFNLVGTLISSLALGILIPKIQYFISKKLKNKDKNNT